jgi:hypothetical protein
VIATIILGVILLGCPKAQAPTRDQARAAVLVAAEAVRVLGEICAKRALAEEESDPDKALELARTCAKSYDSARLFLISTSSGVDAWDKSTGSHHDSLICAVHDAVGALRPAIELLEERGVFFPIGRDAVALVMALGPCLEIK